MDISLLWLFAGLILFAWLVLILAATVLVITRPGRHPFVPTGRARQILTDRYARGEIDTEEYRQRLGIPRETPREGVSHR
jgi:putative membrane protein